MTEEIEIPLASTDKYEEALAKARFEYKENPCAGEGEKRLLEIIFPELKESNDEKIRTRLIALVESFGQGTYKNEMLAYLEKQKEQQPAEWSDDFQENIRILLHDKLTRRSEDGTMSSTVFIDNETLKDIISGIWFYVGKEALKYPNKEIHVPEWSEEDERMLGKCIDAASGYYNPKDKQMMKDWLKALRPQPHWKPSEEQLKALRYVAYHLMPDANYRNEMFSLYYDLKDL